MQVSVAAIKQLQQSVRLAVTTTGEFLGFWLGIIIHIKVNDAVSTCVS